MKNNFITNPLFLKEISQQSFLEKRKVNIIHKIFFDFNGFLDKSGRTIHFYFFKFMQ